MKKTLFVLSLIVALFAFASISFSQSKENKTSDKTTKQEMQKKNNMTHQLKNDQPTGKTIESKSNSNDKAGSADFKGINNKTKTAHLNKNEKEIKKIEKSREHHKKYINKSITKNQSKENANKQKEKK
jgi:lipopolysaccharide export LptBFGC system permease protein LptF